MSLRTRSVGLSVALLLASVAMAQGGLDVVVDKLRAELAAVQQKFDVPGMTAAVTFPGGTVMAVSTGVRERGQADKLRSGDRMFCGSIGKTWFAAVALRLVQDGVLSLDDKIEKHLGEEPWFGRLPNHDTITVRNLMRHDSGLPRWIEMPGALAEMAKPDRTWKNGDQVQFVLGQKPQHPAGKGWAYSDTNYIVLGLIVEKVTGKPIYELVQQQLVQKHKLSNTVPGNQRTIAKLVQGHPRMFARFGFPERSMKQGRLQFDPSSEWCGGGIVTNASDLARWARIYGRDAQRTKDAVAADALGKGTKYGLGVMLRNTRLGPTRGHDGVFIGYSATMMWFEQHDIAVAILANVDDAGRAMPDLAVALADIVREHVAKLK